MNSRVAASWALTLTCAVSGCGLGTAAITQLATGSSSPGGAESTSVSKIEVQDARESPADLTFRLTGPSGSAALEILYSLADDPGVRQPLTLTGETSQSSLTSLEISPEGSRHETSWDFQADVGSGFQTVSLHFEVSGALATETETVQTGNDAPEIKEDTEGFASLDLPNVAMQEEASGSIVLRFSLSDSSNDLLVPTLEYAIADGIDVGGGKLPAEGAFLDATQVGGSLEPISVSSEGTIEDFFWDSTADLGEFHGQVLFRLTVCEADPGADAQVQGLSAQAVSLPIAVDNNSVPVVFLEEGVLTLGLDQRRAIPIPFTVVDRESDLVDLVFQWRRDGQSFSESSLALPEDLPSLRLILDSPAMRDQYQIAREKPVVYRGAIPVPQSSRESIYLPDLAGSASSLLAIDGLVGKELELLRNPGVLQPLLGRWRDLGLGPLPRQPVSILPASQPSHAFVLDDDQGGGFQLTEVELATGRHLREIASGDGSPSAMAIEVGGGALLVALHDGAGRPSLVRVFLLDGGLQTVVTGSPGERIRAVTSLGTYAALFTAGDRLYRADYRFLEDGTLQGRRRIVLDDLASPWGLAVDPKKGARLAYVAESLGNRVLRVDLTTGVAAPVVASGLALPALHPFENVQALCLEANGSRLVAVTDDPLIPGLELRGLHFQDPEVYSVARGLAARSVSVAAGPENQRILTLIDGAAPQVLVSGGVEQTREIVAYAPETQILSVSPAFEVSPVDVQAPKQWRIRDFFGPVQATPSGVEGFFLWDSGQIGNGDKIFFRALPIDNEPGIASETVDDKVVASLFDVDPVVLNLGPGVDHRPLDVHSFDLNGNGLLDLISANRRSNRLSLFFQEPDGSFGPEQVLSTGLAPVSVDARDVDGDGVAEIVCASRDAKELSFFDWDSNSTTYIETKLYLRHGKPMSVVFADLNRDLRPDIVSANGSGDALSIFFQDPVLGFLSGTDIELNAAIMNGTSSVATGDINGDGVPDIAATNIDSDSIVVFFAPPMGFDDPSFDPSADPRIILRNPSFLEDPVSIIVADVDMDGRQDLVVGADISANTLVLFQEQNGFFNLQDSAEFISFADLPLDEPSVEAADVDGNGLTDVIVGDFGLELGHLNSRLVVFLQQSPRVFSEAAIQVINSEMSKPRVGAADLNADGFVDLFSANHSSSSNNITVFLHSTAGDFHSAQVLSDINIQTPVFLESRDMDGDGDLDLISANSDRTNLTIFAQVRPGVFKSIPQVIQQRNPTFPPPTGVPCLSVVGRPSSVEAVDITGDGALDLVVTDLGMKFCTGGLGTATARNQRGFLSLYSQGQNGSFAHVRDLSFGDLTFQQPRSMIVRDLNGDQLLDLAVANDFSEPVFRFGGDVRIFLQSPLGFDDGPTQILPAPERPVESAFTQSPLSVDFADFDQDGDLDLVSANGRGNSLTFYRQEPSGFEGTPSIVLQHPRVSGPNSLAVADFNLDGLLDVVTANGGVERHELLSGGSHNLSVFLQIRPGDFGNPSAPLILEHPNLRGPRSVKAADINNDGLVDVISSNADQGTGGSNNITIFYQTRPGAFSDNPTVLEDPAMIDPIFLEVADLNADSELDIATANKDSDNITIFWGGR